MADKPTTPGSAKPTDEMIETLQGERTDSFGDIGRQAVESYERGDHITLPPRAQQVGEGEVVFPGGRKVKVSDLNLDHSYLSGKHESIFNDPAKHLKNPTPGCKYVWAAKGDPHAMARVRTHQYRRVKLEELKDDTDLPAEALRLEVTQKNPGGVDYVQVYDVVLMEVPPEAVKKLYGLPVAQAVLQAAGNAPFRQLREQVSDLSRGTASVEYEQKEVLKPV